MEEHRRKLLLATRNDTKSRYYKYVKELKTLTEEIRSLLSEEHFETISRITESSREKKFVEVRKKLKNKFELQYAATYKKKFSNIKSAFYRIIF